MPILIGACSRKLTAVFQAANGFLSSQSAVVQLYIAPQNYTLTLTDPTLTVQTEHHKSTAVTVTSVGGFTGPITLSCGTLPTYASCTWNQDTVSLPANGTVSTTLTVDTDIVPYFKSSLDGRPLAPRSFEKAAPAPILAALIPLSCIAFPGRRRLRCNLRQNIRTLLPLILLGIFAIAATGCGDKYPAHTEPGTYSVLINSTGQTANSTTQMAKSTNLTLVVTP